MTQSFFRFPHTPHLAWLGNGTPRDDKVLSPFEANALLAGDVVVEEKVDGANLGFSLGAPGQLRAQNRGHFLKSPHGGQFARLSQWMAMHGDGLAAHLMPSWVAFGEWCAARHSLAYDRLPDWWLMFDLYDDQNRTFQSTTCRNAFAKDVGISTVAEVFRGRATLRSLERLLMDTASRYRTGPIEGIVVRSEHSTSLRARAKLVRPDFAQAIGQHWRSRRIEWNRLDLSPANPPSQGAHG